jgi:small subunit ribosomal protein S6
LRRYETILIAHVDLSEDELSNLIDRYGGIVTGQKGILVKVERWGKRRLAYLIRKQARGFYILIDYAGGSAVVNELERNLKIDDKVLKFMTILKADAVDPEALEQEIANVSGKEETKEPPPAVVTAETGASGAADAQSPVLKDINAKGEES